MTFQQYQPTEEVAVQPASSAEAQADQAQAGLYQNISGALGKKAQSIEDYNQSMQAKKDAVAQGINWTPKSALTEAGRAYNQAGQQIAANNIASDMLSNMNGFYANSINRPLSDSPDPTKNNLMLFHNQSEQYFNQLQQQVKNSNPEALPYLQQVYNATYNSKAMQIRTKVAQYAKAQTISQVNTSAQNLSNNSSNLMSESYLTDDPVAQDMLQKNAYNVMMQSIDQHKQAAALAGTPQAISQAAQYIQATKQNMLNATIYGRFKALVNKAQNTDDPVLQQKYQDAAMAFPENFQKDPTLQNTFNKVGMNDVMSANQQFQISRNLSRMASIMHLNSKAAKAQGAMDRQNMLISVGNGAPIDQDFMAQQRKTMTADAFEKYSDDMQAASSTHALYSDYSSSIPKLNEALANPELLHVPGVDAYTNQKIQNQTIAELKQHKKQYLADPYMATISTESFQNYTNKVMNRLKPAPGQTTTEPEQTMLHNVLADPSQLFNALMDDQTKQAYGTLAEKVRQLQSANGLGYGNQSIIGPAMAKNIVSNLAQKPGLEKVNMLMTAMQNTGTNWPVIQKSLIKQGLPYSDIVAANLYRNVQNNNIQDNEQLVSNIVGQQDLEKEQGAAYWTRLGVTKQQAIQDVLNSDASVGGGLFSRAPDISINNVFNSLKMYPGKASGQMMNGIMNTVIALTASRSNGSFDTAQIPQALHDVLYGLFQNGGQDGYRVPYSVQIKNPSGGVIAKKIDYGTFNNVMKYYLKKAPELAVGDDKNALSGAKWVNTPSGNGMVLVDSRGKNIYFKKNKKPYGFSWATVANPGTLPADYGES